MGTNLTKEKMKEVDKVVKACEKMVKSNQKRREKGLGNGLKDALRSRSIGSIVFFASGHFGKGLTWSDTHEITYTVIVDKKESVYACGIMEEFLSDDEKAEYHQILKKYPDRYAIWEDEDRKKVEDLAEFTAKRYKEKYPDPDQA